MLGWRKAKPAFDVAGLEMAFNNLISRVRRMPEQQQAGVAAGVAYAMRSFGALYPGGVKSFVNQRAKVQQGFVDMLEASANDATNNPAAIKISGLNLGRELATGIRLTNMYFAALLPLSHPEWRTDDVYGMIDRLGDQLRPLNHQGQTLLSDI
jgi:hypothetical protein